MASKDYRSNPRPDQEQELVIQQFLAEHPVKVPTLNDEGEWRFWDPYRQALKDERRRCALREAERRYRHELMDMDEREEVWSRILRLRRLLRIA